MPDLRALPFPSEIDGRNFIAVNWTKDVNYPFRLLMLETYIENLPETLQPSSTPFPWHITTNLNELLYKMIENLPQEYDIRDGIAIHHLAQVESGAVLKPPVVISRNSFVGSHAYLRGGVYLGEGSSIGPGCEVKSSVLLNHSVAAHFNYIGDSIIGNHVNLEAGAVIANHYNERDDKTIRISMDGQMIDTGVTKFGALLGDGTKIGANAVLSPGTILSKGSVVKRLELIDQTASS